MLTKREIELIADAVVRKLNTPKRELVSSTELAKRLGKSVSWVRHHKNELGYIKTSDCQQGRLMFDTSNIHDSISNIS